MSKFFIRIAAVVTVAGLILAGCGNPTGGGLNQDRGAQIGEISGTIDLTDIPASAEVYISVFGNGWSVPSARIDLSGVGGTSATDVPWTIPLHENDSNWSAVTGTQTVTFTLYIQPPGGGNGFNVNLPGTTLDLTNKNNIPAGSLGSVSLATITLSGTINVTVNDNPVPYVEISARTVGQGTWVGSTTLTTPGTGAAWSIVNVPVFSSPTDIQFSVTGRDANGNTLFDENAVETVTGVENTDRGGITLSPGNINTITLSGTINVTINGNPVPSVQISARTGQGEWIGSTGLTTPGTGAVWSISTPAFSSPTDVRFSVTGWDANNTLFTKNAVVTVNGVENTDQENITLDLGNIGMTTLSGTVNVTIGGQKPYLVEIYACTDLNNPSNSRLGQAYIYNYATAPNAWSIPVETPASGTTVYFRIDIKETINSNWSGYQPLPTTWTSGSNSPSGIALSYSDGGGTLDTPTGLSVTGSTANSISLSWNSVSGASTYKLYRSGSSSGTYSLRVSVGSPPFTDSGLSAGTTYYYKISAVSGENESPQSAPVSGTTSGGDGPGGGGILAGAKGKLTLSGFTEFNGKYVYSALVTASGKYLIGTNGVEVVSSEAVISMVQISGGNAEVPLYTANGSGTTVADIYVPYEGSEEFQTVAIMIVTDSDGKFNSTDAANFATNYAALITGNTMNTSFTPSTSGGNITISRNDAKTIAEAGADILTVKYLLLLP